VRASDGGRCVRAPQHAWSARRTPSTGAVAYIDSALAPSGTGYGVSVVLRAKSSVRHTPSSARVRESSAWHADSSAWHAKSSSAWHTKSSAWHVDSAGALALPRTANMQSTVALAEPCFALRRLRRRGVALRESARPHDPRSVACRLIRTRFAKRGPAHDVPSRAPCESTYRQDVMHDALRERGASDDLISIALRESAGLHDARRSEDVAMTSA
jgi:hypothetical protein